ncbi:DNA polymerase III subunit alpha, partial [Candidatus Liberibacter sp.]|uniref:DNA polymerase III subunit alpha n=1 Tax=Candidatus Liberibacter sp. TaxID=34022 RepID=UPI0015F4CD39
MIFDKQKKQSPGFVHLRIHSAYSLLEGALPFKKILKKTGEDDQPAIAVTDTNNLFGALEFSQVAFSAGIQPIIGCQLDIDMQDNLETRDQSQSSLISFPSIILLVSNAQGYKRLIDLVSRMYLAQEQDQKAISIRLSWLQNLGTEGLIMLTGASSGPIDRAIFANNSQVAEKRLLSFKKIFDNRLYVELQRHEGYDREHEAKMLQLAYTHELPLVATNNAFFFSREDYEAHDVLMAIAHSTVLSQDDRPRVTPDHYLKSRYEMISLFSDLPEAVENTVEISKRCSFFLDVCQPILPRFVKTEEDIDDDIEEIEISELRRQAQEGLKMRFAQCAIAEGFCQKDYIQRLDFELDVIVRMKFSGYFLIVADFIQWAKKKHIPVGPGRGSGAGSLVAYALTITDIDPLRFSLLFERFLNPDRMSMPDFDIDFCQNRRDEVIRYVQDKYGHERVAQIITFGSLQAKAALRDVGRALQMPYSQVDRICKLVPDNPANPVPLHQAITEDPRFDDASLDDPSVQRLLDISQKLEGLYRHASTHAAGIVISDRPLSTRIPMYRDVRSDMPVTQFNMKWIEKAGLVKFDFLGLKTLTVLQKGIDLIARRGKKVDLSVIPFDDLKTYELLATQKTLGVFQLESSGMRQALAGMKPDCIEDIIALVSLYRPGPIDNIAVYNDRKNGKPIDSIHPLIDPLLKETQGVIVYQEQVMQIAQVLSGYSLAEADVLRRSMGKKIVEEMNKQRERFISGAKQKGLGGAQAKEIFELLAKFAGYGFNKSHAAAYAVISYRTAWMKAHYPVEFLAASMTLDMDDTEKIKKFYWDACQFGINIIPPSVQTSCRDFEPGDNSIYYSLAAIKGVGAATADHIMKVRSGKPFASLEDFCSRIDPKQLNRRVLEGLIFAGALDCFNDYSRAQLSDALDSIQEYAQRVNENRANGQVNIFAREEDDFSEKLSLEKVSIENSSKRFENERRVLGFYFSGHPLDVYRTFLEKMGIKSYFDYDGYADFHEDSASGKNKSVRLAVTVMSKKQKKTRKGSRIGLVTFSDPKKEFEAIFFSKKSGNYNANTFNKRKDSYAKLENLTLEDCYDHLIEKELQESEEKQRFLSAEEKFRLEKEKPYLLREKKSYIVFVPMEDIRSTRESVRLLLVQSLEKESRKMIESLRIHLRNHTALEDIRRYFKNRQVQDSDKYGP